MDSRRGGLASVRLGVRVSVEVLVDVRLVVGVRVRVAVNVCVGSQVAEAVALGKGLDVGSAVTEAGRVGVTVAPELVGAAVHQNHPVSSPGSCTTRMSTPCGESRWMSSRIRSSTGWKIT